jgi:hypothetical protein
MKRYRKNLQLGEITNAQLESLKIRYGSYSKVIAIAVDRLYRWDEEMDSRRERPRPDEHTVYFDETTELTPEAWEQLRERLETRERTRPDDVQREEVKNAVEKTPPEKQL